MRVGHKIEWAVWVLLLLLLLFLSQPVAAQQRELDWFATIAAGDIVPSKKPAPDIYHFALDQLQMETDVCLAIEDSDNGLHSSLAAGLCTLVTVNGYTRDQDFTGAALVVDQLGNPDEAFKVLDDDVPSGSGMVDVALCRALLEQA